jgi:hypothetical protein
MLDSCEDHESDAEFARAAAAIGSGFVDLASVELQAKISAASAQENARIFELQSVIAEAHEAMADRMRAEQAEIELRTAKLAELDVATLAASGLREKRAEAEARPHDDEPGAGTARLAALIGEGLVACEPHPLLHSYTQRYIASVLRGEQRRELTGLEADLNG